MLNAEKIKELDKRKDLYPYLFREKVRNLKTEAEFIAVFNILRNYILGYAAKPMTQYAFRMYGNGKNEWLYTRFQIPKKSGGTREICAPCKKLKSIQTFISCMLGILYEPAPCVMGFVPNRSVADNAARHVGKNYVFNIDLQNFFPSVKHSKVVKALTRAPFNYSLRVAYIIAGLCTKQPDGICDENYGDGQAYLPQGSPASPVLSNIVCKTLDRRLTGLAKRFGLTYTRYADDITFSSMHSVYAEKGEFRKELRRLVEQEGFLINSRKTRLCKRGMRQEVTGLTVNEKVNVSRKYIRSLRSLAYIRQYFPQKISECIFKDYYRREKLGVFTGPIPDTEKYFYGKINYMTCVRGRKDRLAQHLCDKFSGCIPPAYINPSDNPIKCFLDTCYLSDLEKNIGSAIKFGMTRQRKTGKKILYAYFDTVKGRHFMSVSKNPELLTVPKKEIMVSWAFYKWHYFWLVHMPRIKKVKRVYKCPEEYDLPIKIETGRHPWNGPEFDDWYENEDYISMAYGGQFETADGGREYVYDDTVVCRMAPGEKEESGDGKTKEIEVFVNPDTEKIDDIGFQSDEVKNMFFNLLVKKKK